MRFSCTRKEATVSKQDPMPVPSRLEVRAVSNLHLGQVQPFIFLRIEELQDLEQSALPLEKNKELSQTKGDGIRRFLNVFECFP